MARLDRELRGIEQQFVLARLENMRGVDLDRFEFDRDLTWQAFMLRGDGQVLGRFGGRTPAKQSAYLNLQGFRHSLTAALERHRALPPAREPPAPPAHTIEQYPASQLFAPTACFHCHHVYDFRRDFLQKAGKWTSAELWVYPQPENLGLSLDPKQGNRVLAVERNSLATKVGVRPWDELLRVGEHPVASVADVQHALQHAPARGTLSLQWKRIKEVLKGDIPLPEGWRKTDLSWRWSLKGLQPASCLHGEDLLPEEKQKLGLTPKALAFRQGPFATPPARQADIRTGDIIIGTDGRCPAMTARQFDIHIRLNYRPGDTVRIHLLRQGERLQRSLRLPE